jgi:hypothetical protein
VAVVVVVEEEVVEDVELGLAGVEVVEVAVELMQNEIVSS